VKTSLAKLSLSAQVRTAIDEVGEGKNRRAVRRSLLIDRDTGLPHELPTVFVLRQLGQKARNTQQAVLYDLAFYLEWIKLKRKRSGGAWVDPQARLRSGSPALSEREIVNLSVWCQSTSEDLVCARQRERGNVRMLASNGVDSSTTNRRLRNICRYLVWLTKEMVEGTLNLTDRNIAKSVYFQETLENAFASQMSAQKKAAPFSSLTKADAKALRNSLSSQDFFPDTPAGRRDRLIGRLLLDSGLRAGELLKLQCGDISDNYSLDNGRTVAIVKVIRRPNDHADERLSEPAVKTLPGPISINKALASNIISYIIRERRDAVERRAGGRETPYLFVCHSGPRIGKPISQRNLSRIVSKLQVALDISHSISPHTLRHTHFTELADSCAASGKDANTTQEVLRVRGHWAPHSKSPQRYTGRFTAQLEARFMEELDRQLEKNNLNNDE